MPRRTMWTAVLAMVMLGALAGAAQAHLALKLSGPHRTRPGTAYTVTGTNYMQPGATFLGVFYDRGRCATTFTTELRRSESGVVPAAGQLMLISLPGGAPFSYTVKMTRPGGKARSLCGYLYQGTRTGNGYHTLRVATLGI